MGRCFPAQLSSAIEHIVRPFTDFAALQRTPEQTDTVLTYKWGSAFPDNSVKTRKTRAGKNIPGSDLRVKLRIWKLCCNNSTGIYFFSYHARRFVALFFVFIFASERHRTILPHSKNTLDFMCVLPYRRTGRADISHEKIRDRSDYPGVES